MSNHGNKNLKNWSGDDTSEIKKRYAKQALKKQQK